MFWTPALSSGIRSFQGVRCPTVTSSRAILAGRSPGLVTKIPLPSVVQPIGTSPAPNPGIGVGVPPATG